ncbi:hypothetical protein V5O48_009580 [Marasmius crinis-equi]|uniref:Uncharacterized protein n=1 Tax=Marasmius crinis-equi TaxID=585013 RepID=A0ABR3FAU9_9AGAR
MITDDDLRQMDFDFETLCAVEISRGVPDAMETTELQIARYNHASTKAPIATTRGEAKTDAHPVHPPPSSPESNSDLRVEVLVPSVVISDDLPCTGVDTAILETLGLFPPPMVETLHAFRQREAENIVKIARHVSGLDKRWASEKQLLLEQVEKHGRLLNDGFQQLKGMEDTLKAVSHQPKPPIPHEKLERLTSAVHSSLNRIRDLEASHSRLQLHMDGSITASARPRQPENPMPAQPGPFYPHMSARMGSSSIPGLAPQYPPSSKHSFSPSPHIPYVPPVSAQPASTQRRPPQQYSTFYFHTPEHMHGVGPPQVHLAPEPRA